MSWVEASAFDAGTAFVAFDRHTFGDMAPYLYETTDFGKIVDRARLAEGRQGRARLRARDQGRTRSSRNCSSSAPNSACGSRSTAARAGRSSRAAISRPSRCATSRCRTATIRSCWRRTAAASGSSTTSRRCARSMRRRLRAKPRSCRRGRSSSASPHSAAGPRATRASAARIPPSGAVITYYQEARHLFGKLKIEVLDAKGQVIDTLPASVRRGINRVRWSMRVEAAARAARRAGRGQFAARSARAAGHVHGAHDQGQRYPARRRSRSASIVASPSARPIARRSTTPPSGSACCSAR